MRANVATITTFLLVTTMVDHVDAVSVSTMDTFSKDNLDI